ncbi:hypothetical protein EVAR_87341_1 [Eumeta japonica]|uniref:Uncharacterized protein n=1 Tax=Eumeta variegata TaxID=151549 RepID=A0A4C1YSJ5_EUMVA|nr:hypothetical protein EVAR_87341_1 [Eumeta japonica]
MQVQYDGNVVCHETKRTLNSLLCTHTLVGGSLRRHHGDELCNKKDESVGGPTAPGGAARAAAAPPGAVRVEFTIMACINYNKKVDESWESRAIRSRGVARESLRIAHALVEQRKENQIDNNRKIECEVIDRVRAVRAGRSRGGRRRRSRYLERVLQERTLSNHSGSGGCNAIAS